jgi:hypothetical protein
MGRERRWHAARALPKPNPKRAISMDKFGKSVEAAICSWGIFAAMLARAFTAVSESPGTGCAAARVNHSLTSFQSGYGQHVRTGVGDRVPGLKISAQSIAILALRERVTPHDVAPPPQGDRDTRDCTSCVPSLAWPRGTSRARVLSLACPVRPGARIGRLPPLPEVC